MFPLLSVAASKSPVIRLCVSAATAGILKMVVIAAPCATSPTKRPASSPDLITNLPTASVAYLPNAFSSCVLQYFCAAGPTPFTGLKANCAINGIICTVVPDAPYSPPNASPCLPITAFFKATALRSAFCAAVARLFA